MYSEEGITFNGRLFPWTNKVEQEDGSLLCSILLEQGVPLFDHTLLSPMDGGNVFFVVLRGVEVEEKFVLIRNGQV